MIHIYIVFEKGKFIMIHIYIVFEKGKFIISLQRLGWVFFKLFYLAAHLSSNYECSRRTLS